MAVLCMYCSGLYLLIHLCCVAERVCDHLHRLLDARGLIKVTLFEPPFVPFHLVFTLFNHHSQASCVVFCECRGATFLWLSAFSRCKAINVACGLSSLPRGL